MLLQVQNVHKSFGERHLLDGLELALETGEIIGLFGRNGSGKSTLLKLLFGSLPADKMELTIDGQPLTPQEVIPQRAIAYIPQFNFLPKDMKVRDLIPLYIREEAAMDRVFYAPKVADFERLKVHQLSQGQIKYLSILLIMHLSHPFVLIDEPFAMIDPLYKDVIKTYLQTVKKSKGIVVVDHYYEDVLQVSDRNFALVDGQLIAVDGKNGLQQLGYLN